MRICNLLDRRIGILGMGVEGGALLAALRKAGYAQPVHLFTEKPFAPGEAMGPLCCWSGERSGEGLGQIDLLIRSPGFAPAHPVRQMADGLGLLQTTPTNLFLAEVRHAGLPVVGITGSKGKSTTSTLLYESLREAGLPVMLLGNIGVAAMDHLEEVLARRAITVLELSSYQCADLTLGPSIAVVLNLFPEHMDWHGSVEAYYQAKMRIATTQLPGDSLRIDSRSVPWMERLREVQAEEMVHTEAGFHFAQGWFWRGGGAVVCRYGDAFAGAAQSGEQLRGVGGFGSVWGGCCAFAAGVAAVCGVALSVGGFGGTAGDSVDQ
ncbi:MAG: Mur ligase family protein [Magnetococcus sp. YQC-3]